ncbi:MAG: class I SAM-dependent methyltransferase, partial [Spirochaetia bacterium]
EAKIGRLPNLNIRAGLYDMIISKDLLHHLPDPKYFWQEVTRLSNDNTIIYVMDLIRPRSKNAAKRIVENVSANEPEILKTDFYNSLLAAFTINVIKHQVKKTKFN